MQTREGVLCCSCVLAATCLLPTVLASPRTSHSFPSPGVWPVHRPAPRGAGGRAGALSARPLPVLPGVLPPCPPFFLLPLLLVPLLPPLPPPTHTPVVVAAAAANGRWSSTRPSSTCNRRCRGTLITWRHRQRCGGVRLGEGGGGGDFLPRVPFF